MKKSIYSIIILSCYLNSGPALAGWASGGGRIHRDAGNPWFLENTPTVNYCIEVDSQFGVDLPRLEVMVRWALNRWTSALRQADYDYYEEGELEPYGQIRVGTQAFVRTACADDTDVRFQFGVLTAEQIEKYIDPADFVGIAVRTEYDSEQMRGRGFVYLAPPAGPLAPEAGLMHPEAWENHDYFALRMVLLHEIGHIFGQVHKHDSFMDERWPELVVEERFQNELDPATLSYFQSRLSVERLIGVNRDWFVEGCGSRNPVLQPSMFGVAWSATSCGKVEMVGDALRVFWRDGAGSFQLVAQAKFFGRGTASESLITAWLPRDQKVFSKLPDEAMRFKRLWGTEHVTERRWSGTLELVHSGEKLPVQIVATDDQASASVIKDGLFENDVFFLE